MKKVGERERECMRERERESEEKTFLIFPKSELCVAPQKHVSCSTLNVAGVCASPFLRSDNFQDVFCAYSESKIITTLCPVSFKYFKSWSIVIIVIRGITVPLLL